MATDASKAAQILRGHEERLRQLEEEGDPDRPANLIRVVDDETLIADSASTVVETDTKYNQASYNKSLYEPWPVPASPSGVSASYEQNDYNSSDYS